MTSDKIWNVIIRNKSAQACYNYGASVKEINHIDVIHRLQMFPFILSILHAWIYF
jgi:hypothetical protein